MPGSSSFSSSSSSSKRPEKSEDEDENDDEEDCQNLIFRRTPRPPGVRHPAGGAAPSDISPPNVALLSPGLREAAEAHARIFRPQSSRFPGFIFMAGNRDFIRLAP